MTWTSSSLVILKSLQLVELRWGWGGGWDGGVKWKEGLTLQSYLVNLECSLEGLRNAWEENAHSFAKGFEPY